MTKVHVVENQPQMIKKTKPNLEKQHGDDDNDSAKAYVLRALCATKHEED